MNSVTRNEGIEEAVKMYLELIKDGDIEMAFLLKEAIVEVAGINR